ncbi:hypothetical protein GCM10010916_10570 [Paenibacillus abyssi]|uniref:Uncharacterized protein n=1 Tax=Paenibacillus abyssi TaxID=1340531 RepID=A0A917CPV9_9BACL|nr:hypothetical protein GCM10010916_10570 [Paenibacillus abyssi]
MRRMKQTAPRQSDQECKNKLVIIHRFLLPQLEMLVITNFTKRAETLSRSKKTAMERTNFAAKVGHF